MAAGYLNRKLVKNMTVFGAVVVFGLIIWAVVTNVVVEPKITVSSDISKLTAQKITPDLEFESVELMQERRSVSESEVAEFTVYLDNSEEADGNTEVFMLRVLSPTQPYDLGYWGLQAEAAAASAAAVLQQTINDPFLRGIVP